MPNMSSQKAAESPIIGKAGEYLVAGELMSRFMNVSWPSVDEGWDLLARNGCRIQVKTGRLRHIAAWSSEGVYSFHLKYRRLMPVSGTQVRITPRKNMSEYCDVVVLLGLEQRRFWVIPAKLLDGVHCAYMGPSSNRDFEKDIPEMQEMVKLGFTQKEIGQYYGINQASVCERLQKAGMLKAHKKYVGNLRACENAWHHIIDFGQPEAIELQAPATAETNLMEE